MEIKGANIAWGRGLVVDLLNIGDAPITIEDYAYALAYSVRWRGQARSGGKRCFYGVAEHCWRGAMAILDASDGEDRDLALAFLGHESDEVPFGDMAGPAKSLFQDFRPITKAIGYTLRGKFRFPSADEAILKHWDDVMLVTEKRDLMGHGTSYLSADGERMVDIGPLDFEIEPFAHPDMAAEAFLTLYRGLGGYEPSIGLRAV